MNKPVLPLSDVGDLFVSPVEDVPLVVDMDGTLFVHDIFSIQLVTSVFRRPFLSLRAIALILRGQKSRAKQLFFDSGQRVNFAEWPLNEKLDGALRKAHENGREIVLCSGSNENYVAAANKHLPYLSSGYGSTKDRNLTAQSKRDFLVEKYGDRGFDYIGNSKADYVIYECAREAISTNAYSDNVTAERNKSLLSLWLKQFRIKHWAKNLLIFFPLLAAFDFRPESIIALCVFFILFSLQASGTYVINDLLDLQSDITHEDKKHRPIASGALNPILGLLVGLTLIAGPLLISLTFFPIEWLLLLVFYLVTTLFYSMVGKRILGLDIILLAVLYTFRIFAGIVVIGAQISVWILALSFLLFYSMASVKRFVELKDAAHEDTVPGRSYMKVDTETIAQIGTASGVASVLIFMLYATSDQITEQYSHPYFLLLGTPILMYWISHLWISARRSNIHSDPIDWALRDRKSWISFALLIAVVLGAWGADWLG